MIEGTLLSAIIADSNLITGRGEALVQLYNCPQGGGFISSNFSSNLMYWQNARLHQWGSGNAGPISQTPICQVAFFSVAYIPLSLERDCFPITMFSVLSPLRQPIREWKRINSWRCERCVIWERGRISSSLELFHVTKEWMMLLSRYVVLCTDFKTIIHSALCWYSIG